MIIDGAIRRSPPFGSVVARLQSLFGGKLLVDRRMPGRDLRHRYHRRGPAGSHGAALLPRAGRRVVLRARKVSAGITSANRCLPFSMKAFTRLGLHEKFLSAGFLKNTAGKSSARARHWNKVLFLRRLPFANRSRVSGNTQ